MGVHVIVSRDHVLLIPQQRSVNRRNRRMLKVFQHAEGKMEIVNGYVCLNCADTAKAKRNIDPSGKGPGPEPATGSDSKHPHVNKADEKAGLNSPLTIGPRGTRVNLLS